MTVRLAAWRWVLLPAAVLVLLVVDLASGPVHLDPAHAVAQALRAHPDLQGLILREIRLPRALLAAFVGAALGGAGAAMQGLLRNPLAGPGLVGVTNCAALGAVITFYFGLAGLGWYVLPAGGMAGAALSVLLIFFLAGREASVLGLILAGVAINAVAGAFIAMALNFAPSPYALSEIVYWLMGSVADRTLADVAVATPFIVVGLTLLLAARRYLDALSLGEETAATMGFAAARERAWVIAGVALSVGAAVSVSGNIAFVGLIVPHLLRPWVHSEPGRLVGISIPGGAALVLAADIAVQWVPAQHELQLGVVTALVGGPFFLALVWRMRREVT